MWVLSIQNLWPTEYIILIWYSSGLGKRVIILLTTETWQLIYRWRC